MATGTCLAIFTLACGVCSPALDPSPTMLYDVTQFFTERESTVVLLNQDSLTPSCSAVSIYDYDGSAVLATAAHCLLRKVDALDPSPSAEKEAHEGDRALYVTRNDWYYTGSDAYRATIKRIDFVRDRAVLSVNQFEVPPPLPRAEPCDRCLFENYNVHSVGAVYEWARHSGVITGKTYAGYGSSFVESSISINYGWSGSPVFNDNGEVMGLIIRCDPDVQDETHKTRPCKPGWSLFTSLP